jgi:hypothetical protein
MNSTTNKSNIVNSRKTPYCINDKCKRCDIGYLIKDFLKPLLQAITVHVREYNMRLIQTKCLNTAVSIVFLLFGKKALKHTVYCDVSNVVDRHHNNIDNSSSIASKMKKDILRKTDKRYVYYIMLTDGYFIKPDGSKAFFPGHVFVIEKIPWGSQTVYYLYQSYIDNYTFAQYIDKYKTIKISQKKVEYYMSKINDMVSNRVWDADFVKFWQDLTKVDTSNMLNGVPQDAFFVCYRKIKSENCMKNLLSFVKSIRKTIPKEKEGEIYGSPEIFDEDSNPLTNGEMRVMIEKLNNVLENNVLVNNNVIVK